MVRQTQGKSEIRRRQLLSRVFRARSMLVPQLLEFVRFVSWKTVVKKMCQKCIVLSVAIVAGYTGFSGASPWFAENNVTNLFTKPSWGSKPTFVSWFSYSAYICDVILGVQKGLYRKKRWWTNWLKNVAYSPSWNNDLWPPAHGHRKWVETHLLRLVFRVFQGAIQNARILNSGAPKPDISRYLRNKFVLDLPNALPNRTCLVIHAVNLPEAR